MDKFNKKLRTFLIGLFIITLAFLSWIGLDGIKRIARGATIFLTPATSTIEQFRVNYNSSTGNLNDSLLSNSFVTTSINNVKTTAFTFASGTTGNNFNIATSAGTVTFNLPNATSNVTGLVSTGTQTFGGLKTFKDSINVIGDLQLGGSNGLKFGANSEGGSIDPATGGNGIQINGISSSTTASFGATDMDALGIFNFSPLVTGVNRIYSFSDISGSFVLGTSTLNRVAYWTGTQTIQSDADLLFDGTLLTATNLTAQTSLQIPNGASPTVDATGEVALDTTANQLLIYDGTAARVYANPIKKAAFSFTSSSLLQSPDYPLWRVDNPITITRIDCLIDPADSNETVTIALKEGNGSGDSATTTHSLVCDNIGGASTTSPTNPNVGAPAWMLAAFSNSSTTITGGSLTIQFREVRQ